MARELFSKEEQDFESVIKVLKSPKLLTPKPEVVKAEETGINKSKRKKLAMSKGRKKPKRVKSKKTDEYDHYTDEEMESVACLSTLH